MMKFLISNSGICEDKITIFQLRGMCTMQFQSKPVKFSKILRRRGIICNFYLSHVKNKSIQNDVIRVCIPISLTVKTKLPAVFFDVRKTEQNFNNRIFIEVMCFGFFSSWNICVTIYDIDCL